MLGYDVFTNLIMFSLVYLSVYSWSVIIYKNRCFKKIKQANKKFMESFRRRKTFNDPFKSANTDSASFAVLAEGLAEAQRLSGGEQVSFPLEVLPNIQAAMERSIGQQEEDLSSKLISLASITSISPLLGLLGTVWGIMIAFVDIKNFGSSSIQVVAPGIAEALVTTIAGLVVAIPASMAYNAFNANIRQMTLEMENLSSEFLGDLRMHSVYGGK
ncbi:MotA/TolQ/ExbB proton channel family protein [candidate division TA06 bacterium]|uniref:MotA/TolQ/ExbB proton channel family protein n=1 Tax=candidate division TA06 bacterium TaxID=2250710 RepID=A0A933ICK0_UNCT6|nr:MotA/TolQ/ExbB proton channel family protein [candidate division TA06 bacterium]